MKDYGTNNIKMNYKECINNTSHDWIYTQKLSEYYNLYVCVKCKSKARINSSV